MVVVARGGWVVALALLAVAFSGCLSGSEAPVASVADTEDPLKLPPLLGDDGRDLRRGLRANDSLEVPQWQVGYWFGHHVLIGMDDQEGVHFNSIVVKEEGENYLLAPDGPATAKIDAVMDIPILGPVSKKQLTTSWARQPWELYQFPLADGKKWSKDVHVGDLFSGADRVFPADFAVTYNAAIATPDGTRPGFDVVVTTNGTELMRYDFVPDIGWYAHFYLYDVDTADKEDYVFHSMSMGHGVGWTGTYYQDTATSLVYKANYFVAFPLLGSPPQPPEYEFNPYLTFTVAADATYVYGYMFSRAAVGVHETLVLDPHNEKHEFTAVGQSLEQEDYKDKFLDARAVAGDWRVFMVGAGAAVVGGVFLWQIVEHSAEL